MTTSRIGLSLSFCVSDILKGKVELEGVGKIISGTHAKDNEAWEEVFEHYRQVYWREFPNQATAIARQLVAEGKVEQPRLKDDGLYPIIASGHWVENEDQITWSKERVAA